MSLIFAVLTLVLSLCLIVQIFGNKILFIYMCFRKSNCYNRKIDMSYLYSDIHDLVGKIAILRIFDGRRIESVRFDKVSIPFDFDTIDAIVDEITNATLEMVSPMYLYRLKKLYYNRLEDHIRIKVKDEFMVIVNTLVDEKLISARKTLNDNISERERKLYVIDNMILSEYTREDVVVMIEDYSGLEQNRLEYLIEFANSDETKRLASGYKRLKSVVDDIGSNMNDYMNHIIK